MARASLDPSGGDVVVDASGRRGVDGRDGHHGASGGFAGADGLSGGAATRPTVGEDAGHVKVELRSGVADGELDASLVGVRATAQHGAQGDEALEGTVRLDQLRRLLLRARGGDGGHGARGGDGGAGARGRRGSDATRYSSGGNGGRGGDGGDGGRGTSGAAAGAGGSVTVAVDERETFLLMAVADAEAPRARVEGGDGGRAGQHGRGGHRGSGGPGGSSYHWTETHTRTESYTDANGTSQTRTVTYTTSHSNPGGSRGPSGFDGATPSTPLHSGRGGADGRFVIEVVRDGRVVARYPHRYDLELTAFHLTEPEDDDGVLEFGESLAATGFEVVNVGGMPTPSPSRVRLTLERGALVHPVGAERFLARSLPAGDAAPIEGSLAFEVPDVAIAEPGPPLVRRDEVRPRLEQLGVEVQRTPAPDSWFVRRYDNATLSRPLVARFPLRNSAGPLALRSLGPGEMTRLRFEVENLSRRAFGRQSERGRRVAVRLELTGGDVAPEQLLFFDANGREHPFVARPDHEEPGWFVEVDRVEPETSAFVSGRVGFTRDVATYAGADLMLTLYGGHVQDHSRLHVMQKRALTLRVEPGYTWEPDTRVLLVTNNNTTREAWQAWHDLLERQLGLPVDDWSLTRYGHFDQRAPLPDGTDLHTHLEDKLVVFLNNPFHAGSSDVTEQPAGYLKGEDFRVGATRGNTHLFIAGAGSELELERLLHPTSETRTGGDDFESARGFLKRERASAGPLVTETFKEDLTAIYDEVRVEALTWPFFEPRPDALKERAQGLMERLQQMHPNRRYVIVYRRRSSPEKLGRFLGFIPRWHLGELEVRRTLNDEASSAVLLAADPASFADDAAVLANDTRFGVLCALPFPDKLDTLARLLAREDADDDTRRNTRLLADAILIDLAEEQDALRRREDRVDEEVMEQKLANLVRLSKRDFHIAGSVEDGAWDPLLRIAAGVRVLYGQHERWWRWFGRQRRINKFVERKLAVLMAEQLHGYGLGEDGGVALPGGAAAHERVAAMAASMLEDLEERDASLRRRLTLLNLRRPELLHRDIDAWDDPAARVWSEGQLHAARKAEARRAEQQERLRQANVAERAAMLVYPDTPFSADAEALAESLVVEEVEAPATA